MTQVNEDGHANEDDMKSPRENPREPLLNLPPVISLIAILIIGIHAVRTYLFSEELNVQTIYLLAFFPASYGSLASAAPFPMSGLWSPVTHSLLHADWVHVGINLVWLAAFGTPVAKRFGAVRFILLVALCSAAGALAHYITAHSPFIPVIGASGAVAGCMGAALRFLFDKHGRRMRFNENNPAMTVAECFRHRQFLTFFVVWMGINYLFGSGWIPVAEEGSAIAWQAHIGGFLAGIFLFSLFERSRPATGA